MNAQIAQVGAGLVAAMTPWMVTRVAHAVACNYPRGAGSIVPLGRSYRLLGPATLLAGCVVGALGSWLPAPSAWMALVDAVAFAGLAPLGLHALGHLDDDTRDMRQIESSTRTASLAVRRHRDYLSASRRTVLYGVATMGFALFAWRALLPTSIDRRLLVPVACCLIASVFMWLYEAWIRALVTGPIVPDSPESTHVRRRLIQRVFATEFVLVVGFLALAHALLNLDWTAAGWWPLVAVVGGGVMGVVGCALALSADLGTSRYRVVST